MNKVFSNNNDDNNDNDDNDNDNNDILFNKKGEFYCFTQKKTKTIIIDSLYGLSTSISLLSHKTPIFDILSKEEKVIKRTKFL